MFRVQNWDSTQSEMYNLIPILFRLAGQAYAYLLQKQQKKTNIFV